MGFAYTSHTPERIEEMLAAIGVDNEDALYDDVPSGLRLKEASDALPRPHAEVEVFKELSALADQNLDWRHCIMGAGFYAHYVPAAVKAILYRSEFYTSYTPYQPEFSQGTLQALFEYQSLMTRLTGLDVCNASEYDGGTALGSALFMTTAAKRLKTPKVALSPTLHPQYAEIAHTYGYSARFQPEVLPGDDFIFDPGTLSGLTDKDILVTQFPNCYGYLEDLAAIGAAKEKQGFQWIVVSYPQALSVLQSPAAFGADVMVGDGQCFANGLQLGGPTFGYLTARKDYMRQMPGRMVGLTQDVDGKRGYVLTLQTREQHIRREKATSNICTNQTLNALAGTIYLSLLGPEGLRQVGLACAARARQAARALGAIDGVTVLDGHPFFNEFVVKTPTPKGGGTLTQRLREHGILGPFDLSRWQEALAGHSLFAFTELLSREDVEEVTQTVKQVLTQEQSQAAAAAGREVNL